MRRLEQTPSAFFDGWSDQNERTPVDADRQRSIRKQRLVAGFVALAVAAGTTVAFAMLGPNAGADPSAHTWYRLRMCESSDNYQTNTGNGYYGAYQFDVSTWRSVGGSGYPNQASKAEQDARALMLYRERGWQPWTCAHILGLREDKDARSGRISDIKISNGNHTGHQSHGGVPPFPGSSWYYFGDNNANIKQFQNEMHHRGYFPAGTGQYGPLTLHMVKKLQRQNGLPVTGYIGPNTWRLAWVGKYTATHHKPAPHKPAPHKPVHHKPVHHKPVQHRHPQAHHVPAFPSKHWFYYGNNNAHIKQFQNEMHHRGYFPAGTGQYGPLTLHMVKKLQRLNGLPVTGYIGPNTWRLAWVGKYHK
ncbi:MAG TPA: peptidoglycan-binding protein [Jatrophihabitantaceae bacterium]